MASAEKDGKELELDLPLFFYNPPIKVGNGTFIKKTDELTKKETDVENTVEDLPETLKEIVGQCIKAQE